MTHTLKISNILTAATLFDILNFYKATLHSFNSGQKPTITISCPKADFQAIKFQVNL